MGTGNDHMDLNPEQRQAVLHGEGPLLILAGAGSGKTRVLTRRIAHLIESGVCRPDEVLAVTFTNKAARELNERLAGLGEQIGSGVRPPWVGTFHAICLKILRTHGTLDGRNGFSVLDARAARQMVTQVCAEQNINPEIYSPQAVTARISRLKNELIGPDDFAAAAQPFGIDAKVAQVYPAYEANKKRQGVCDFDDLLLETHRLLTGNPTLGGQLAERFRYLFVDEFQDTNTAQFAILKVLARGHGNLCVVGDDDQSIYAFRGANVGNILAFTDSFPDATVVTLARNYRSTGNILKSASAVIAENRTRHKKALFTDNPEGDKLTHHTAADEMSEVRYVVAALRREVAESGRKWSDMAILYRANSQARVLEEGLSADRVPYRVVGGMRFYQRKEVRDLIAYLRLTVSGADDDAFTRVLNSPPRGIGTANRERIRGFAAEHGISQIEALSQMLEQGVLKGVALRGGAALLTLLGKLAATSGTAEQVLRQIVEWSAYTDAHGTEPSQETRSRREIVEELIGSASAHGGEVRAFLDDQVLAGAGDEPEGEDAVALMTLHAAKGLEFPVVFMIGMEEGLFPHSRSRDDEAAMGEERRLCYVGMTRARQRLYLISAASRRLFGEVCANPVSRFVGAIPMDHIDFSVERRDAEPYRVNAFGRRQAADPRNAQARRIHAASGSVLVPKSSVLKAQAGSYTPGDQVRHAKFGMGRVRGTEGTGDGERVVISFSGLGTKKLSVKLAKLEVIS